MIAWLWTVQGHPREVRGVSKRLGTAQQEAEKCLLPQTTAVVESAVVIDSAATGQHMYVKTGRRCTASLVGNRACWTDVAVSP